MRRLGFAAILALVVLPCSALTLQDELKKAAIPTSGFSRAELAQSVNGTHAERDGVIYFTYMRLDSRNMFTGRPQIIRYDARKGAIDRQELNAEEYDCCGSPLGIDFTRDYLLISFHDTPSATTVLVTDERLLLVSVLFGFDIHEISPDVVAFTENMVHFAAQHQERMRVVNLRTGASEEVYPPKGDELRAEFVRIHQQHMPSQQECMKANDPCDPNLYDEDLRFRKAAEPGKFEIVVTRTAEHNRVPRNEMHEWPIQVSVYTYARGKHGWIYCERDATAVQLIKSLERATPVKSESCVPNIPVIADTAGVTSPSPAFVRKVQ